MKFCWGSGLQRFEASPGPGRLNSIRISAGMSAVRDFIDGSWLKSSGSEDLIWIASKITPSKLWSGRTG